MEEVGKYQSLQDRIKRLTKNQANSTGLQLGDQQTNSSNKFRDSEDAGKQNMARFTFAKKRQQSQTNLRNFTGNKDVGQVNQRAFQSIANLIGQNAQYGGRDLKTSTTQIKKTSHIQQYGIRKPATREPYIQNSINQSDLSSFLTRQRPDPSSKPGTISDKYTSRMYMTQFQDPSSYPSTKQRCSYLADSTNQQVLATTRRQPHGAKKSLTNLYSRPDYSLFSSNNTNNVRVSTATDENVNDVGDFRMSEQCEVFARGNGKGQETRVGEEQLTQRARMLTKCKSGMLERVPGRIMRNK